MAMVCVGALLASLADDYKEGSKQVAGSKWWRQRVLILVGARLIYIYVDHRVADGKTTQ